MARKSAPKAKYENNPFFVAGNGITALFDSARGVAVALLVISIVSYFGSSWPGGDDKDKNSWEDSMSVVSGWSANEWTLAIAACVILGLALMMLGALFGGVSSYTSWKLSRGEQVKIGDAFRVAFDKLWSYLWLQILIFVKVVLWTLLFILPGIYFAFRYTLAGVAFFDENKNLRGNAAVKESLRLTKGGWITTFASNTLFNLLTFGILSSVIATGVNSVLYRQFGDLGNKPKPNAHWLSWVTLGLPLVFVFLLFAMALALLAGIAIGSGF